MMEKYDLCQAEMPSECVFQIDVVSGCRIPLVVIVDQPVQFSVNINQIGFPVHEQNEGLV